MLDMFPEWFQIFFGSMLPWIEARYTIVYAINFGDNGRPNIDGIVFSQDEEHPTITLDALTEALSTGWGPSPSTGDAGLDQLLNGQACRWGNTPLQHLKPEDS